MSGFVNVDWYIFKRHDHSHEVIKADHNKGLLLFTI